MSMTLDSTIRAVQTKLGVDADGNAGPATWAVVHSSVLGRKAAAGASLDDTIRAVQKKLGVFVDGSPGLETWGAIHLAVVGKKAPDVIKRTAAEEITGEGKKADSRSESNIATLHPRVRPYARALIERAAKQGILIKVTSGMRSYQEQKVLHDKYLAGGPIAAPPGKSNHNFGLAFDITMFKGSSDPEQAKTPVWESPAYKAVGALGAELGLEWGGNWRNKVDEPHFQLRPGWAGNIPEASMLAELRRRKEGGSDYYT